MVTDAANFARFLIGLTNRLHFAKGSDWSSRFSKFTKLTELENFCLANFASDGNYLPNMVYIDKYGNLAEHRRWVLVYFRHVQPF